MPRTKDPEKQARVILALEALKRNEKLSIRAAARLYNIPATTLSDQRAGRPALSDTVPSSKNLTQLEEEAVVVYIIELSEYTFPPRLYSIEDIANHLLYIRGVPPIGKLWVYRFVKY
jgi:hypothetical protein